MMLTMFEVVMTAGVFFAVGFLLSKSPKTSYIIVDKSAAELKEAKAQIAELEEFLSEPITEEIEIS